MTVASASPLHLGVVILAAGKSSRMGRPKLLLPWHNTTVLGYLLEQWSQLGARQMTVVYSQASPVQTELDRLGVPVEQRILNPAPERGMFSSIQSAARWVGWDPQLSLWAITLGDQPHLRPGTLRGLIDFAASNPTKICQPTRGGRYRHPVVLPRPAFRALRDTTCADLNQFLLSKSAERAGWESDDWGLDLDIDQPSDYERALRGEG